MTTYMRGKQIKDYQFLNTVHSVVENHDTNMEQVFEPDFYVDFLFDDQVYSVELVDQLPNGLYVVEIY